VHLTLLNYVRGAVNLELEAEAQAQTGLDTDEWMRLQDQQLRALLDTDRFQTFARLTAGGYDFDLDALFEFGLQRLIDGIATVVDPKPR
jgi:hypothetical protein